MASEAPSSVFTDDFVERSYWLAPAILPALTAPQGVPSTVDVAIIGGGYTGLSAAAVTARGGRSTLVLEAEHLGFGCSARNGGQVATSLKPNFDRLKGRFGEVRARAILQEGIDALEGLRTLVADEGLDCDWQPVGRFCAAHSEKQFDVLARFAVKQAREFDIPAVVVSKAEQHRVIATARYHGGVLYPRHAAVHPGKLLQLLYHRAIQAGAEFVSACPVLSVDRQQDRFVVRTALGVVLARDVIIATNG
jgi:glycine/D-amino acid oxidase-like deaminating enzyme